MELGYFYAVAVVVFILRVNTKAILTEETANWVENHIKKCVLASFE